MACLAQFLDIGTGMPAGSNIHEVAQSVAPQARVVYVDDIDAHYQRARAVGATIVTELASPWGLPFYVADDLEGNRWTFAQARPTMRS